MKNTYINDIPDEKIEELYLSHKHLCDSDDAGVCATLVLKYNISPTLFLQNEKVGKFCKQTLYNRIDGICSGDRCRKIVYLLLLLYY
jgi:hypothetical protein